MEAVASNVKELLFVVERNTARMIKYMIKNELKYEDMPCLSSIEFCVRFGEGIGPDTVKTEMTAMKEQCSRAAEGCRGVTLHATHAIFENLPDIFS